MHTGTRVAIRCKISKGGFSSERVFRIRLNDGEHVGAAPIEYFSTNDQRPLPADRPANKGEHIEGFIAGRIVAVEDGSYLVSVPSGEVLLIPGAEIIEQPAGNATHVPVQS